MKINNVIILLILLSSTFSCSNSDTKKFTGFPYNYDLKGEIVGTSIPFSQGILNIYDSLLIVTSTPNNLKCIHYFNKNTFQYISSTGIIGKGPKEIANPGNCCIDKKNGIIWYPDYGKKVIWKFNIEKSLKNNEYLPESKIPLPENIPFFFYFASENDSLFSFCNNDNNKLISFFDKYGNVVDSLSIMNKDNIYDSEIPIETRMSTAIYLYEKNDNTNEYIIAYRFANVIKKITNNGESSILIDSNEKLNIPDKKDYLLKMANECIKVYKSTIFCLFSGQPRFNADTNGLKYNYPKTINIYNKFLNPIAKLNLDFSAMWFEVDMENDRIITFSPQTGSFVNYQITKDLETKLKYRNE